MDFLTGGIFMSVERGVAIAIGFMMICVSIYYYFSKKPVTIYNNSNPPRIDQITNIRSYNHATSRLMLIYGMVFIFEGLMIHGKLICFFLVILTVMPGIVIVIAIYESVILKKYLKRR